MAPDGGARSALGIDVGGANLKWGRAERTDETTSVRASGVVPFPLWREPDALAGRLRALGARAAGPARDGPRDRRPGGGDRGGRSAPDVMALSLTAELADCFPDRAAGVRHVVGAARQVWGDRRLRVLCRDGAWRTAAGLESDPTLAAAANWRAPAAWLAERGRDVVLADMGSTTTDLVPIRGGEVGSGARTDLERLAAGELVYTGLLRTPVSAMIREVDLPSGTVPVAAERFAIAADVHLRLGSLSADEYRCDPPDGGPVTAEAAGRRLARMVCSEPDEIGREGVDAVARAAAGAQARDVVKAVERLRRRARAVPRRAVPTGAGADLLAAHLRRAGLEPVEAPPPLAGEHAAASTATTLALLALAESG